MEEITEATIIETPNSELHITKMSPGSTIESNISAVKSYVDKQLEHFSGDIQIAKESDYKEAKQIRAGLNSLAKGISEKKLMAKKAYMAPYETFAKQVDDLTQPIKDASSKIDSKIKQYEEDYKTKKRIELQEHYSEIAPALTPLVPYKKLEDQKWMNRTCRIEQAKNELEDKILEISKSEETIKSLKMDKDIEEDTLAFYFDTLDFKKAATRANELKAKKEQYRELEQQRQEWKQQQDTQETPQQPQDERLQQDGINVHVVQKSAPQANTEPSKQAPTWYLMFEATTEQAKQVGAALKSIGLNGTLTANKSKFLEAING